MGYHQSCKPCYKKDQAQQTIKEIHDPSEKIRDQLNYPKQILDLKESRLRAIDAFSAAKN